MGIKGTPPTILVVDDNWENRFVLVELLAPLGCAVYEAENGREGLTISAEIRPDAIIADLLMPVMDGFEFIRQVKQPQKIGQPVVIATSASVYEDDYSRSLEAGSDAFLPKPIDAARLFELLAELLSIEWEYQDMSQPAAARGDLIPPRDILEALLLSARQGNLKALQRQLTGISQNQPQYTQFIMKLEELARRFKVNEIERVLEEML